MSEDQIRRAIGRRAADWFAAHREGAGGEAERRAFFDWLRESPVHVAEYLAVAATDRSLQKVLHETPTPLAELVELARTQRAPETLEFPPERPRRSAANPGAFLWTLGVASAILLCLLCALPQFLGRHGPAAYPATAYRTGHGAEKVWQLADGSELRLDSDSEAEMRFSPRERLLRLERGQAFFHVAHEARPFRVQAGAIAVTAVGTRFDVYRRADTTLVTVIDGRVVVADARGNTPAADPQSREISVGPGEQVRYRASAAPVGPVPADLREATAWLDRKVVFQRRPLGEVAAEFNRYNTAQIAVNDPALRVLLVSGAFDADDLNSFTAFLGSLDGIRVTRTESTVTVEPAPPGRGSR